MHWIVFALLWMVALAVGEALWATGKVTPIWLMCYAGVCSIWCGALRDVVKKLREARAA